LPQKTLIFIPTYNESDNAPEMVKRLSSLALDADLLFLDDNSPDGTGILLDQLAESNPRLHVIHRAGRLGVGSAHVTGINWAYENGYDTLVTMDCDFTHAPEDIPRMLRAAAAGADVVLASRYLQPHSLPGWNLLRRLLTNAGHLLTRTVLGMTYDATGALRVYNLRKVPRAAFALVRANGYAFFFESLFVLHCNRLSIAEVPIKLPARTYGHSKMSFREALRSARQVISLGVASLTNPAQFLVVDRKIKINPALVDPQGWDKYWEIKTELHAAAYDLIAWAYRTIVIRRRLERYIRKHFSGGSELVHAGCGSGQVDQKLSRQMKVTALDISVPALRLYARNNPDSVRLIHGSILDIPLPGESVDGVYNLGVIEHFNPFAIRKFLQESRRVLRPGGKVIIFWPHKKATSVAVLKLVHWLRRRGLKNHQPLHAPEISLLPSKTHALNVLREAGFEPIDYYFGLADFGVQAVVVGQKPLRQRQSHSENVFNSHDFASHQPVALP
jgi:dolichol-phosphate mannosyltransferase